MSDTRSRFLAVFPRLTEELVAVLAKEGMPKEAQDWYRRNLEYNTPHGKLNRGLSIVDTVQILLEKDRLDDAEFEKAAVLGWCVELVSMEGGSMGRRKREKTDVVLGINTLFNNSFKLISLLLTT
jgi:hypothetical protein